VREKYCSGWKNKLNKTDYKPDEQGLYVIHIPGMDPSVSWALGHHTRRTSSSTALCGTNARLPWPMARTRMSGSFRKEDMEGVVQSYQPSIPRWTAQVEPWPLTRSTTGRSVFLQVKITGSRYFL
jgi:hypothetical protein